MSKKKIGIILAVVVLVLLLAWLLIANPFGSKQADEISKEKLELLINTQLDDVAKGKTKVVQYVAEQNELVVQEITYGNQKDIRAKCTVKTLDVYRAVSPVYAKFVSIDGRKPNGMPETRDKLKMEFEADVLKLVKKAQPKSEEIVVTVYQTQNGLKVHTTDAVINAVYGGNLDIRADMTEIEEQGAYTAENGEQKKITSTNVPRGFGLCFEVFYDTDIPDTSTYWGRVWNGLTYDFYRNFVQYGRWMTLVKGLGSTLALTFLALILGLILGFVVAFIRCLYLKASKPDFLLRFFNGICQVYLTVIRGTPVVVQVMIIYFVIFMPLGINKFIAAVVCFGLNSGAYVAEILRGGIMSVDQGQTEAGRSLGFGYMQTMYHIIFPQAFKAVLPALANEFIVLLKETSVAFCIGMSDLMYAGNAIRAATYTAFMPLVTVAIIYLIMVMSFSKLVSILERRLRKNER